MKSKNSSTRLGIFLIVFGVMILLMLGHAIGVLDIGNIVSFLIDLILPIILLYLLISIYLKRSAKKAVLRGTYGEREVDSILSGIAEKVGGIEFLDLLLVNGDHFTQIDNMLLTSKALYVIETKDYSGWIFGSQYNTYWTQTFKSRQGIKKYKFYNPIMQNQTHIEILKKLIPVFHEIPIINIIVFTGSGNLKDIKHNEDIHVIYSYGLKYLINELEIKYRDILSINSMMEITDKLYQLNSNEYEDEQKHILNIKNKKSFL